MRTTQDTDWILFSIVSSITLPTYHYTAVARTHDMCNSKTPPSTIVHPRWPRRPHLDEPPRSARRHHVQARGPLAEQVSARNDTHCFPQALLRHLAYAADLHANTDRARDLEASRARPSKSEIVRVAVYNVPSYGRVGNTDIQHHKTRQCTPEEDRRKNTRATHTPFARVSRAENEAPPLGLHQCTSARRACSSPRLSARTPMHQQRTGRGRR